MTQPPETKNQPVPFLDGVGITPQGELAASGVAPLDLPAAYRPKQTPVDPALVERAGEELECGRQQLMMRVFGLMTLALFLTAAVAFVVGQMGELQEEFKLREIYFQVLFFCELASVITLARIIPRLDPAVAGIVFIAFAAFNGISFSVFAPYLPAHAIAYGFLLAALTFAATWFYAYKTRLHLGNFRAWAVMLGVGFGLIFMGEILFRLPIANAGAAFIGITFFCNLVAYHASDIEDMYLEFEDDAEGWKAAFCGALLLYLDFVNLYILVLSLLAHIRNRVYSED